MAGSVYSNNQLITFFDIHNNYDIFYKSFTKYLFPR